MNPTTRSGRLALEAALQEQTEAEKVSSAQAAFGDRGASQLVGTGEFVRAPSEDQQQAFATLMRTARENRGLTPAEVEHRTGVPAKYIEELEAGRVRRPQPWALHYLAVEYRLDYKSLMLACGNLTRRLPGKLRAL